MKSSSLLFYLQHPVHGIAKIFDVTYRKFKPGMPWISPQSVAFLKKELARGNLVGFEWGSGASTNWFSQFCSKLVSIEYDEYWYQQVQAQVKDQKNIQLLFVALEHSKSEPTYLTYEKTPAYVTSIHQFPEEHFDFVVVDGHYRQACILACQKHLKRDGLLIVDNFNRIAKREDWGIPSSYEMIHCSSNIVTTTAVFRVG